MALTTDIINATSKGDKEGNAPNQDFIKVFENDNSLIVAVSDGLGSARNSLEGAKEACKLVVSEIKKVDKIDIADSLIASIPDKWNKRIESKSGDPRDYRTTSSFVAVMKNLDKIIIGRLGDVSVSIRIDGLFRYLDSDAKVFLNETRCLGSGHLEKYKFSVFDFTHSFDFLIATDGIGDELLEDRVEELHNYLKGKYNNTESGKRNRVLKKEIVEFLSEKNNDDKSLVFVWANKK